MGFCVKIEEEKMQSILRDKRISLKAKGLYYTMLINPKKFFTIAELSKFLPEGKDAIRSAAHELEEFGYIERTKDNSFFGV